MSQQPKPLVTFRGAVFGANRFGIQCINPPKEIEDCGLYIHVDDLEKYLDWQKQQNLETGVVSNE